MQVLKLLWFYFNPTEMSLRKLLSSFTERSNCNLLSPKNYYLRKGRVNIEPIPFTINGHNVLNWYHISNIWVAG